VSAPELAPDPQPIRAGMSIIGAALRVTLVVIGVIVVVLTIARLETLVLLLLVALILAAAMHAPVLALERRGLPRVAAILSSYGVLVAAVAGLLLLIGGPLVEQLRALLENAPQILDDLRSSTVELVDGLAGVGRGEELMTTLAGALGSVDLGGLALVPLQAVEIAANLVIITFLSAFLLLERDRARRWFLPLVDPTRRAAMLEVSRAVFLRLGHFVRAQLLLMTIVGFGMGLALVVLGVPFVLPLAVFAFVAEAIPMLGPWIAIVPAAIVAFSQSPLQGLLLLAFWFVLQQIESYVLTPTVLGRVQHLSPTVVLLSVLGGFQLFGVVGALIAVPVVAGAAVVVEGVLRPAREAALEGA
jgi:predicted PurR-regulated permease PerM